MALPDAINTSLREPAFRASCGTKRHRGRVARFEVNRQPSRFLDLLHSPAMAVKVCRIGMSITPLPFGTATGRSMGSSQPLSGRILRTGKRQFVAYIGCLAQGREQRVGCNVSCRCTALEPRKGTGQTNALSVPSSSVLPNKVPSSLLLIQTPWLIQQVLTQSS